MPKKLPDKQIAINTPPRPELDLRTQETDLKRKPSGDKSLFTWVRWYIAQEVTGTGKSENTVIAVHQELQKFINYFYKRFPAGDYTDWTRQVTQAFIKALRDAEYSLNSMRKTLSYVKAFASYLNSIGMVNFESHPTRGAATIKAEKEEFAEEPQSLRILKKSGRVAEEGQPVYERMKKAAVARTREPKIKPSALPYRDLAILTTLYYTGLRAHELCLLKMKHIIPDEEGGIWFDKIKRKGDANFSGSVYMRKNGLPYLDEYFKRERDEVVDNHPRGENYVFLRYRGERLSRADIWSIIRDLALAALTPEMIAKGYRIEAHPHSLRHEITYKLLEDGYTETETAHHLGHASTRYISRYSKRSKKTMASKMESLPD
jgi:site-specific recombinase XerD